MRTISLLGPPSIRVDGQVVPAPSGRKPWALLAYLVLEPRPPSRSGLTELLFPDARDPLRALRWNLTALRQLLGGDDTLTGDPVRLQLAADDEVDVRQVLSRSWPTAEEIGGLGETLLEGLSFEETPLFAAWLDLERHHLRAANEALLTDLAVESLAHGDAASAAALALRVVRLDELNAEHQALLVGALVASGQPEAAQAQVARCAEAYDEQLGQPLPDQVARALAAPAVPSPRVSAAASVRAAMETGRGAVSAGAVQSGVASLREAAAGCGDVSASLRAEVMLELGSALVHSTGDRGVQSARWLQEAFGAAAATGQRDLAARAALELGFVQVQLGRRERAEAWLDRADQQATRDWERSRIFGVRSMNSSDAGRYDEALAHADDSVQLARSCGHDRSRAWSLSMIGRVHVLLGRPADALVALTEAAETVAEQRWTAFVPWVDAMRSDAHLALGDQQESARLGDRAYALAHSQDDHCWLAVAARTIARHRLATGDLAGALDWVEESLRPEPWYLWCYGRALQTGVEVATAADDARADAWRSELAQLAGRAQLAPQVAYQPV